MNANPLILDASATRQITTNDIMNDCIRGPRPSSTRVKRVGVFTNREIICQSRYNAED
jgi:hypothetical protein